MGGSLRSNALLVLCLAALQIAAAAGCGSGPAYQAAPGAASQGPLTAGNEQARLKDALTGGQMTPSEVAEMSDRLLADSTTFNDQKTMARLELLLLTAIKSPDKSAQATLWRNLGILHYHQQKYREARQELQTSNEINPKSARTHFYLARLFTHQGEIYERKGEQGKSRQQFKRAAIEMEQARKIEPGNPLFRQDVKQMIGKD
ncbi:MAG: tetratricopeptide repeat protein [Desulfobaccales bacterium]